MRLVLVTHYYPAHGGGIEKVAAQLARGMTKLGVEVVWFASDTDAPPDIAGVRCEPMRTCNAIERASGFPYPLWSFKSLQRLAFAIAQADAVHVHDCIYASSLVAAWLARRHRKRLVVTQHIGWVPLPPVLRPVLGLANRVGQRAVLRPADGVAFISPAVRQYFESLGGDTRNFHDVPNGVDGSVFSCEEAGGIEDRVALGFEADRPLMLFVGRFVPKKRLPLVREMASMRSGWQWCLVGQGPEQPQDWGLANVHVRATVAQSELARYYRAADLLVLPSEGEGFPLVVQEAMACGLPPLITAEVAAGGSLPADLWLQLPEKPGATARLGVECIDAWLGQPPQQRDAQRAACAAYAAHSWRWDAAVRAHLRWLQGEGA